MRLKLFYFLLLLGLSFTCFAQNDEIQLGDDTKYSRREKKRNMRSEFETDTVPSLNAKGETPKDSTKASKKKKKKVKKKVFYGYRCGKGFTKKGVGATQSYEIFYFLKKYHAPPEYAKEIFVYDARKAAIIKIAAIDPKDLPYYRILHGTYKRYVGLNVVEEGIYFLGTQHGRWEKYKWQKHGDEYSNVLIDKTKYYKGFPKESKISYYDEANQTKVKEVIPYNYNDLTGDYYYFKENGEVLINGEYKDGQKAGIWHEYFEDRNRKKREIQYPKDPRLDHFEPYVIREWDELGNLIILDGKPVDEQSNHRKGGPPPSSKQKKTKPAPQAKSSRPPVAKSKTAYPALQPDSTRPAASQTDSITSPVAQPTTNAPASQGKSSRPPVSHKPVAPSVQPKSTRPPVSKKK